MDDGHTSLTPVVSTMWAHHHTSLVALAPHTPPLSLRPLNPVQHCPNLAPPQPCFMTLTTALPPILPLSNATLPTPHPAHVVFAPTSLTNPAVREMLSVSALVRHRKCPAVAAWASGWETRHEDKRRSRAKLGAQWT